MTSKLTREFMQNIISGHGFGVAPSAVKAMAEYIVAAMDSEPVAWIVHARTGDQLTTDSGYVANAEGILGLHSTPLYRHAQQPVVPDERAAFNAWNNEDNLPIAGVGAKNAAWLAWQARAKLAGNSPVTPDGYVMVPKLVTPEIGNAINEVGHRCTCGNCSQRLWGLLLAAAPQEVVIANRPG